MWFFYCLKNYETEEKKIPRNKNPFYCYLSDSTMFSSLFLLVFTYDHKDKKYTFISKRKDGVDKGASVFMLVNISSPFNGGQQTFNSSRDFPTKMTDLGEEVG